MRVPFTLSNDAITVFLKGKMYTLPNSDISFKKLKKHLKKSEHNIELLEEILDKPKAILKATAGKVTVVNDTVYYNGEPLYNALTEKLLTLMSEGFDIQPWAKFMDRMMQNPSFNSRKALYSFLDHYSAPITEDGYFIAFKRVNKNFKDIHTNTMDNRPGTIVRMPRSEVDENSNNTCSSGLHACAEEYLKGFATGPNYITVAVKINPRDVCAVPNDYKFSKMRVCEYLVLGIMKDKDIETISKSSYVDYKAYTA